AWENRGLSLSALGRYEEAIASYDRSIAIKPDDASAFYNKACCYGLQNQVELAVDFLQQAIELDPQCKDMAKTDTDFELIRGSDRFQALIEH
ncbi:MAG: tetratricopeptide repeat protein, partial [Cyanobacteria bacterium CAN_BIN43]|nr:tetratricopeptide repeat protein [Cyanobacteria bacterium CAN_BIN43]